MSPRRPPNLPLSAFVPSQPPGPVNPTELVDSCLRVPANPASRPLQYGNELLKKIKEVVVMVDEQPDDVPTLLLGLQSRINCSVISVSVPFSLVDSSLPPYPSGTTPPITLSTSIPPHSWTIDVAVKRLQSAMMHSDVIDIEVNDIIGTEYDSLEDLLTKAILDDKTKEQRKIVLSNVLPSLVDLSQEASKSMSYQSHISALSLFEGLYIKLTPPFLQTSESTASPLRPEECKSWLKLCLAPIIEAFGFERMMVGSSPAKRGGVFDVPDEWYDLVQKALSEFCVERVDVDKVFKQNALRVYGSP